MLVFCFLRPELVFLRLRSDKQTNKQTDYHNPSAHARRGYKGFELVIVGNWRFIVASSLILPTLKCYKHFIIRTYTFSSK